MTRSSAVVAVVLAGGRSRRFGADKVALLLDATLAVLPSDLTDIVCVGPDLATVRAVRWTREEPHFAGPLAALAAGCAAAAPSDEATVVVVAADMPRAGESVPALLAAVGERGARAAAVVDAGGVAQPLLLAAPWPLLRSALAALEPVADRAARDLVRVLDPVPVRDVWGAARDVDTRADLAPGAGVGPRR